MKVSKVVMIVVALHVLVIGGIIVFEGCSRAKSSTPDMAANESPAGQQPDNMTPGAPGGPANSMPNPQGPGAANSLAPANSVAGNEAVAPAPSAPAAAPTPAAHTYVVKKGDSLWKIAKAENLTVGELSRANNLTKTSALKIGQKLSIPVAAKSEKANVATASVVPTSTDASGASAATAASTTAGADAGGATYTVQSGDSLWKIARKQSVSVAALKQANNLSGDSLKVGQKLHIPVATAKAATDAAANTVSAGIASTSSPAWQSPGSYTENGQTIHVVDFNESPSTIAKRYGIKVDDLLKANNITDARKVQYGQRLVIPTQQPAATASTTATPATTPAANTTTTTAAAPTTPALAAPVVSASRTTVQ
jgi:LysM repeat protein